MQIGAITGYIDVAQLTLYAFWAFFAGLILYLRREDKREGYPLLSDRSNDRVRVIGFPPLPRPKMFHLADGGTVMVPRPADPQPPLAAEPSSNWPGAPLVPIGDPMVDGVGPAAYALRAEVPDHSSIGLNKVFPMRLDADYHLDPEDPDPRGMSVIAADGLAVGRVSDLWVDRTDMLLRYLEVELPDPTARRSVLVPINLSRISTGLRPHVRIVSVMGRHFATAPVIRNADEVTSREEDRITAYFASGHLYAEPGRLGPLF